MGCQDGSGPGSGVAEDQSKVIQLRKRILQLAGHEEEEKLRTELLDDLNMCKRDTLIEICHSFDITGSRANRKEELVSFLMKFLKNNCSRTVAMIPVKVSDLQEQILQLAEHSCHEEERSRSELLERLNVCKRDTLIELCRSFDLIGSRANRKEELVSFLMKFVKEHSSAMDGTNPDKKIKKRRRVKEEENLSSGKPLKKKKREGTALETQDEEEANVRDAVESERNYSVCDGKDNRFLCADSKNGKFSNDKANLEPMVRKNGFTSDDVDAATLNEDPIRTNEQALTSKPSTKVVTTAEFDGTNMKAITKKHSSVTKAKPTPKSDHKAKSSGKKGFKGDTNPRKLAMKPSRDELREAIVLILDSTDFAMMTFGDVVKEVDKYFGKDLFERKPLIRSLIEEELFRLSEEAEKKELEEEEAAEAKARAEQSAKDCGNGNGKDIKDDERVEHAVDGDGKAEEASKEKSSKVAIHGDNDGKEKEGNRDAEQRPTDSGSGGKAEDANHNVNTKDDVDSDKNGAAENGKTGDDVKADGNGIAEGSQM